MTETHAGSRLGRYRLVQRVGEGGMGVVHLGLDDDGRAVAVKVLRPHVAGDPDARERLAREVDTLRRVRHPRVAAVLDADVDGPSPYVVTQYVPAPPLDRHVKEAGPLDAAALARLGDGLGEALAAVHAAGVVHRDLKPGNVLMLDGDPVVIDFGIAHVADDVRLTATGLVMGTPGYLSPEVVAGHPVSTATDWWGWAATMAFAATGRPPFGRGPVEVVLDRARRGEADLDGVPPALVDVLVRGLSLDPLRRPLPGELRQAVSALREQVAAGPGSEDVTAALGPVVPVTRAMPASPDRAATTPVPAPEPPEPRTEPVAYPQPRYEPPTEPVSYPQPRYEPTPEPYPYRQPGDPGRYADDPYDPYAAAPPAPPRRRSGTLAAALVALAAVAAVAPAAAAIIGVTGSVLARTVDRSQGALLRRRHERGPRRSDVAWAVVASPARLVGALLVSVPAALLPILVGVSTVFLSAWVLGQPGTLTTPAAAGAGGVVAPGGPVPLAVGALAATLTAWWGPGGGSLRRGSRTMARSLAPGARGGQVAVALLALVVLGAVLVVLGGAQPDWAPFGGPPLPGSW